VRQGAVPALAPAAADVPDGAGGDLRHVALLYRDEAEYLAQVLGFAQSGMARGEPLFIAVPGDKARLLGGRLSGEPGELLCCDMADMGRNPARIIPEVRAFADKHAGQYVRFVGEPIWPGRSAAEICEATRHEALINLAFPRTPMTVLCPYDATGLAPSAIAGARRTHPELLADGRLAAAAGSAAPWEVPPECDRPLPPPPASAEALGFETDLVPVRRLVASHARRTVLGAERTADLVLAASETAANTLGHTSSGGVLHVWHDEKEIFCQIHDQGMITDPLAGRVRRGPDGRGHGLFLVNQVCDLVELRTGQAGTTVRMHMRLRQP
jgi:anti-sigma regulatory factor (Ser/Thr protein kinase)